MSSPSKLDCRSIVLILSSSTGTRFRTRKFSFSLSSQPFLNLGCLTQCLLRHFQPRKQSAKGRATQCLALSSRGGTFHVHVYGANMNHEFNKTKHAGELFGSKDESTSEASAIPIEDTMFIYYPDRLPSQRQLHYQLCDIMDDKLQELIHSNDGKEQECTV